MYYHWAYSIEDDKVTLVGCSTREAAIEEKERMKHSRAKTVGFYGSAMTKEEIRQEVESRNMTIKHIRIRGEE